MNEASSPERTDPERTQKKGPSAWDSALRLLGVRARSRHEMRERLTRKGFDADTVDEVMTRLDKHQLLDDTDFAAEWVRSRHLNSGKGRVALGGTRRAKADAVGRRTRRRRSCRTREDAAQACRIPCAAGLFAVAGLRRGGGGARRVGRRLTPPRHGITRIRAGSPTRPARSSPGPRARSPDAPDAAVVRRRSPGSTARS